jgi:hypothetical protein
MVTQIGSAKVMVDVAKQYSHRATINEVAVKLGCMRNGTREGG